MMRTVQIVFLALFALCSVVSFLLRLRMGMIRGAIERGEQPPEKQEAAANYYQWASRFSIVAAIFLMISLVVGIFLHV